MEEDKKEKKILEHSKNMLQVKTIAYGVSQFYVISTLVFN